MYSGGGQYWLDNRYLDYGNDDYYGMPVSDTWWDVQDSIWLRHLNEPTYTLDLTAGVGAASTTSDLPGVDCRGSAHCVSTWDANTAVMLTAAPANGYARVQWGGACASAGSSPDCTLTMSANQKVTVSYTRQLAVASFAAPRQTGTRLQARLTLSRRPLAGEARLACRATPGLKTRLTCDRRNRRNLRLVDSEAPARPPRQRPRHRQHRQRRLARRGRLPLRPPRF